MNHSRSLAIGCLIVYALCLSCKKNQPAPHPPIVLDSFQISLNFPYSQYGLSIDPLKQYELIISETGGRVVLDTVTPYNTPVIVWLKTNQKLLDVTTVRKWATTNDYLVHSYKAIDLTGWVNIPENDSVQLPTGGTAAPAPVTGLLTYTHINVPYGSYYNVLAGGRADIRQTNDINAYATYNASPGDYAYLIFPDLGLYNIHRIVGAGDSVDLSKPDTTVRVSLSRPAAYTTSGFSLAGYPDPGDLSHLVNLAYYNRDGSLITDASALVYPGKKGFKKYYFSYYVSGGVNNSFASVNLPYIDTIPASLPVPDPGWYSVSLTKDTAVSVDFTIHKPTYYDVTAHLGYIQFTLTAPGDSALLHPVPFFLALKSKLLAGQNLRAMQMDNINIVTDAEPGYQAYWAGHTHIYQFGKTPGSANAIFQRHF
jgi:hypothetical protein